MESPAFLKVLRQQTLEFIALDPTSVVLTPRAADVKGPGGGIRRVPGAPRSPQVVKLIHQGGRGISKGEGGEDRKYDYVIVLAHDGAVAVGDQFSIDGNTFIVSSMDPDNGYEKKAYASQYGKNHTDG